MSVPGTGTPARQNAPLVTLERLAGEAGAPVFAFHTVTFMTGAIALYERIGDRRAPESGSDLAARYGGFGAAPSRRSPVSVT